MARPSREGLEYFAHDVDASNDEKIESMEAIYGALGYAFYFKLVERIYRSGGVLDVSAAETRQILSRKCLATLEEWERMLGTALRVGLFDAKEYESRKVLTSDGIKRRCSKVFEKRENMAQKYRKRVSASETDPETRQNDDKVKESKVKESKEEKEKTVRASARFVPPTLDEVRAYCAEKGSAVDPEAWWNFYDSKGWMVGKNKMVKWKAAIATWEKGNRNGQFGNRGTNRRESRAERLDRDASELLRELGGAPGRNPPPDQPDVFVCEPGEAGA